jgi:hypothetical protein
MRSLLLALCFWFLAAIFMACAPDHASECLCDECYTTYSIQWEIDHMEGIK